MKRLLLWLVALTLFTAMQEQLGLKLDPVKTPIDVLMIDRVESRPITNLA